jgi:hypothetical protein
MGALLDQVGGKAAGELIRSTDWNALVEAVDALQAQVAKLETDTEARFATDEDELHKAQQATSDVQANLDVFRTALEPVTFRAKLQAARGSYALGEIAELTATVASLTGDPLSTGGADRPWVEFVATWGQLRAADGFESVGGVGDRTMSVHTDATGAAKVLLAADHLEGFSTDVQDQVAGSLQTQVAANVTLAQAFLTAATPKEAKDAGAMKVMADEYDRPEATSVRSFVDAYHLRSTGAGTAALSPVLTPGFRDFQTIWQDHRATVMAFAKADQDATTPDENRGVGAVTVTFRDWIRPWISLQYLDAAEIATRADALKDQLGQKIGASFADSIGNMKVEIGANVGTGVLQRQRDYAVIGAALDRATPPAPVPYDLLSLTKPLQDGLALQQTLESVQFAAPIQAGDRVVFDVLSNVASRGDTSASEIKGQLDTLNQTVAGAKQTAEDAASGVADLKEQSFVPLQNQVFELSGKFDGALSETGTIGQIGQRLQTVETRTNSLQAIDPTKVNDAIGKISGIQLALDAIKPTG